MSIHALSLSGPFHLNPTPYLLPREDAILLRQQRVEGVVDEGHALDPLKPGGDRGALVEQAAEHEHGSGERWDCVCAGGRGCVHVRDCVKAVHMPKAQATQKNKRRHWDGKAGVYVRGLCMCVTPTAAAQDDHLRMVMAVKGLAEKEAVHIPRAKQAQLKEMKVATKRRKAPSWGFMPVVVWRWVLLAVGVVVSG